MEENGSVAEPRLSLRHICRHFHRLLHRLQSWSIGRVAIQTTLTTLTLWFVQHLIELCEELFLSFYFWSILIPVCCSGGTMKYILQSLHSGGTGEPVIYAGKCTRSVSHDMNPYISRRHCQMVDDVICRAWIVL